MPVQVLVAVTTHNNIVSTNFGVAGAVQGAFSLLTPLEEKPSSRWGGALVALLWFDYLEPVYMLMPPKRLLGGGV